jgi:hypothetical protein
VVVEYHRGFFGCLDDFTLGSDSDRDDITVDTRKRYTFEFERGFGFVDVNNQGFKIASVPQDILAWR